ncbi:hypothetical protein RFI_39220, partial [Reticulomyxa filosa]
EIIADFVYLVIVSGQDQSTCASSMIGATINSQNQICLTLQSSLQKNTCKNSQCGDVRFKIYLKRKDYLCGMISFQIYLEKKLDNYRYSIEKTSNHVISAIGNEIQSSKMSDNVTSNVCPNDGYNGHLKTNSKNTFELCSFGATNLGFINYSDCCAVI